MTSKVWFTPVKDGESAELIARKAKKLFDEASAWRIARSGEYVAVKIHFGEGRNIGHIKPQYIRPLLDSLKARKSKVFLTDTNTLYKGNRSNSIDHLMQAYDHGFTPDNVGVPVIIADGLLSKNFSEVPIKGKHLTSVKIANDFLHADAVVVLSHPTGHVAAGMGAAIKNVAMGAASRSGKQIQHADVSPRVDRTKCTACQLCIKWCPVGAISLANGKAQIDPEVCYGCAECITTCRFNAIRVDWSGASSSLQEKMAEYAAGALQGKEGKMVFANFLIHITKDCDCMGEAQRKAAPDVGILLSFDPVAIDQATADLLARNRKKSLFAELWPANDYNVQLAHAEAMGLGSRDYEIVEVK